MRWTFDVARDPDNYFGSAREVLLEGSDVLVLVGPSGVVLTRYQVLCPLNAINKRILKAPERQAYAALREL